MITNDHQKHTEFLKECLRYDENTRCQELAQEMTRIQRDECCVQRATWLMAVLTTLALALLVYPAILLGDFPYSVPRFMMHVVSILGLASFISLLTFLVLGVLHRQKLNRLREESRRRVAKLLETRMGNNATTLVPAELIHEGSRGQIKAGDNGSSAGFDSAAHG
jgi:hypothetical protein